MLVIGIIFYIDISVHLILLKEHALRHARLIGFFSTVVLFLFSFAHAHCQPYEIPMSNNLKMIDFAGLSSVEWKTALSALLNLMSGVDYRDKAKEVMSYQKCHSVMECVSISDVDIENSTLHKKREKNWHNSCYQ